MLLIRFKPGRDGGLVSAIGVIELKPAAPGFILCFLNRDVQLHIVNVKQACPEDICIGLTPPLCGRLIPENEPAGVKPITLNYQPADSLIDDRPMLLTQKP